jgi:hypothetical protein
LGDIGEIADRPSNSVPEPDEAKVSPVDIHAHMLDESDIMSISAVRSKIQTEGLTIVLKISSKIATPNIVLFTSLKRLFRNNTQIVRMNIRSENPYRTPSIEVEMIAAVSREGPIAIFVLVGGGR